MVEVADKGLASQAQRGGRAQRPPAEHRARGLEEAAVAVLLVLIKVLAVTHQTVDTSAGIVVVLVVGPGIILLIVVVAGPGLFLAIIRVLVESEFLFFLLLFPTAK